MNPVTLPIDPTSIIVVVLILAVAVLGFFVWKAHNRGVANNLLLPTAVGDLRAAAATEWASAQPRIVEIEARLKTGLAELHDRFDQIMIAAKNKGQLQVGQTAFDQWDAIGPFWVTDNEIRFDDKILRTGTQPAYTFKSQPPGPGGNTPVTRES